MTQEITPTENSNSKSVKTLTLVAVVFILLGLFGGSYVFGSNLGNQFPQLRMINVSQNGQ